jgi:ribosomal protein L18
MVLPKLPKDELELNVELENIRYPTKPRLSVYRSNKEIYAQSIDDVKLSNF